MHDLSMDKEHVVVLHISDAEVWMDHTGPKKRIFVTVWTKMKFMNYPRRIEWPLAGHEIKNLRNATTLIAMFTHKGRIC